MKTLRLLSAITLTLITMSAGGCAFRVFDGAREKCERTINLSEPLTPDSKFAAQTANGHIAAIGIEGETCQLSATLTAYATTLEEARLLAEQTEIKLERTADGLRAIIVRPELKTNESVCVSYDVRLPHKTGLDLQTSNGKITITQTQKDINAKTSNGRIEITNCSTAALRAHTSNGSIDIRQTPAQSLDLHTSNGSIKCEDITGSLTASTSNGSVNIRYASDAPNPANIRITTSNGGIDLTPPANYSAKVDAKPSNGKIRTNMPITVQGEIGKTLNGIIGSGEGQLYLQTSNSSININ